MRIRSMVSLFTLYPFLRFLATLEAAPFTVEKKTSANFGDVFKATIGMPILATNGILILGHTRVYFRPEQIVIGDFNDNENSEVTEAVNLGRQADGEYVAWEWSRIWRV